MILVLSTVSCGLVGTQETSATSSTKAKTEKSTKSTKAEKTTQSTDGDGDGAASPQADGPSTDDGGEAQGDGDGQTPSDPSAAPGTGTLTAGLVTAHAAGSIFPAARQYSFNQKPNVPAYSVSPGLANVANRNQYIRGTDAQGDYWFGSDLSEETMEMIAKNGFAVSDAASWRDYYGLYEENRYSSVPSFITTDSALHSFHLMYDYVLKNTEQTKLYGKLQSVSDRMVEASYAQYQQFAGTDFEGAALRNVAFFTVGSKLLDESFPVYSEVAGVVDAELAAIKAQSALAESPISGSTVDYSQFIVRGHYTHTEQLKRYFAASMWYGLVGFSLNLSKDIDLLRSYMLMTSALWQTSVRDWLTIFETINFFVGECDDVTLAQFVDAFGTSLLDMSYVADPAEFDRIALIITSGAAAPGIGLGGKQFRFLGQRFTVDGVIFQNLISPAVNGRALPNSLDIPAAFGSQTALGLLAGMGETDYQDYMANMEELRDAIRQIPESTWSANLYWSWMNTLRPLADDADMTGYPMFMQNEAWTLKELNTFQGSWTELKHDTILYAKQPTAEMGGDGDIPEPPDDRGYVEPNPELFGRLSSLVAQTYDGLEGAGLMTEPAKDGLAYLQEIADNLKTISEKELTGQALTDEEYDFIRYYGGRLEHIFNVTGEDENDDLEYGAISAYEHPEAVIADVASNTVGQALEEATGYAKSIFVAFPRGGEVVLGRGVVYSQYEFAVPSGQRMTDEAWHDMLSAGQAPPPADWKGAFTADIGAMPQWW
jgi:hypothetical protein